MIHSGQLVMLVSPEGKRYFRVFNPQDKMNTHDGAIDFSSIGPLTYGANVTTHIGRVYRVLKPTLYDLIKSIRRRTQIIYPKDIGYILVKLGVGPGTRIVEAGSGSGSLTTALAWCVGDEGMVYTFERRPEFSRLCRENLQTVGLAHRVTFADRDIQEGFGVADCDCLFLDVRTPWEYLDQIRAAVLPGCPVGFLLPTTNQISDLLTAMGSGGFADIEVLEILLRRYKPVADRLRPDDRMVAHTGFLLFARSNPDVTASSASGFILP
jgi:tRNA (adenine57-N1/adenine58-N1)-methyltransferase catalytic subunit